MILDDLYLQDVIKRFRELKLMTEKAIAQMEPANLFKTTDDESNSIVVMMKHISGNLRSRWTNFLTTDGEKPDRHRDQEFELGTQDTLENSREQWDRGWACLFEALTPLKPEDLYRTVTIRGETHYVFQAINRQLTHYGCHVGQIVFLAKHLTASRWKSLSIPRGKSQSFNEGMQKKLQ
jgi:hypothetical protein